MAVAPFGAALMNFVLNHSMNEALVVFSDYQYGATILPPILAATTLVLWNFLPLLTSSIFTPRTDLPYSRISGLFIPLSSIYARVSSGI
jgi:hypothetical protein